MKHTFVLDENVLISASTGKNAYNQIDYSSCILLFQIARNCHKIAWNNELRRRYSKKSDRLLRRRRFTLFMKASRLVFHLMTIKEKNLQNENYLKIDQDLEDDRHIVSLAVSTGGILVTEDHRLKKLLQEKNLVAKHNLMIVKPKEALSFADET